MEDFFFLEPQKASAGSAVDYLCCGKKKKQKKKKKGCRTGSVAAYVQRVIKVKDLQFSPGPPTASHPFRNY